MVAGIKNLTIENWLQADPTASIFVKVSLLDGKAVKMSGDDWAKQFLEPALADSVPENVRLLFEVARGSLAYGYFFYPLYTLAGEQLCRVVESAILAKCRLVGAPAKANSFDAMVKYLRSKGFLSEEDASWYQEIRRSRNSSSHPQQQTILPPGAIASQLTRITWNLNRLFVDD